jgi:hypothetical protein
MGTPKWKATDDPEYMDKERKLESCMMFSGRVLKMQ